MSPSSLYLLAILLPLTAACAEDSPAILECGDQCDEVATAANCEGDWRMVAAKISRGEPDRSETIEYKYSSTGVREAANTIDEYGEPHTDATYQWGVARGVPVVDEEIRFFHRHPERSVRNVYRYEDSINEFASKPTQKTAYVGEAEPRDLAYTRDYDYLLGTIQETNSKSEVQATAKITRHENDNGWSILESWQYESNQGEYSWEYTFDSYGNPLEDRFEEQGLSKITTYQYQCMPR